MVNLQVRNVPPKVHAVLKRRAAAAGQSLQEYVLALLTEHASHKTVTEVMDEVRAEMAAHPEWFRSTTDDITETIRRDRESH
ncbi:MAG: hypothetical protein AB1Z57_04035 [Acidimicrobiia bacterium]